jgi:hypothetical protein
MYLVSSPDRISVAVLVLAAAGAFLSPSCGAQSVADAAREARERVDKSASKPAKVITNDDLEKRDPSITREFFPGVRASFHPPDGWILKGTTDWSAVFDCPGTTLTDECFIVIRNSNDVPGLEDKPPAPDWEKHCLQDDTQKEPLSGPGVLLIEPWHDLSIGSFHARQTVLETGLDLVATNPDRHERRKYLTLADPDTKRCYSIDTYVPASRADEYFAAYDKLVASFQPAPRPPQQ